MIPLESLVREIRPLSSESGDWKRSHDEERGTGIAKAAGNSYPHRLPLPRQSPTLQLLACLRQVQLPCKKPNH